MPIIMIEVNRKPVYKIQRKEFSQKDAENIVSQLRFAQYDNYSFNCTNKTTANLIYSLFVNDVY